MSWEMVKLDDCLEWITYGFTNPMPDAENGPWKVTAKDIIDGRINFDSARHTTQEAYEKDLTDKSRPIKDDLLLTKDGTLGRVALVGEETICINQSVALLRLKKDIIAPEYLLYLLQSSEYQGKMLADAGGSTIKHIYITKVNQMQIPLPPPETQRKLVDILQAYDKILNINQKQIKLLEEAAQRLYKEWFVDLCFPGHENTLITDGVPQGWKKVSIGEITPILTGKKDANFGTEDGEYPFFTCSQEPIKAPSYSFDTSAVILAGNGDFNVKLYRGRFEAYQRTYVLSPNDEKYLYLLYNAVNKSMAVLVKGASGSTIKFLTKGMIENIPLFIPTDKLLEQYNYYSEAVQQKLECLKKSIKIATEARDRLLPKLVSGELEV